MNIDLFRVMLIGGWPSGPMGGVLVNLAFATIAFWGGWLLALPMALLRLQARPLIAKPIIVFVELVRSTPLILLVFWCHFSLPLITGGYPNPMLGAIFALILYSAAHQSEIFRAGFSAVPAGEVEAGFATGMTRSQSMFLLVVPQGLRSMTPASVSFAVSLFKDTAVIYVVGVVDLMQTGLVIAERRPSQMLVTYLTMGALFFLFCGVITLAGRVVERRFQT